MKAKLIVFWCSLWGCEANDYGYCRRCGEHYYGLWYEYGRLRKLQSAWYKVRYFKFRWPRCAECGKRMAWSQRHHTCCSDECYDKNVPF